MSIAQVKSMLDTCFGCPEKARLVRDKVQGHSSEGDDKLVMCIIQAVREQAEEAGHYVESR